MSLFRIGHVFATLAPEICAVLEIDFENLSPGTGITRVGCNMWVCVLLGSKPKETLNTIPRHPLLPSSFMFKQLSKWAEN